MKRILICGSNGLLGQRLALSLCENTEYEVLNTSLSRSFVFDRRLFDYTQLDITRKSDVKSLALSFNPDVIVNAAAAPDPDWCELNREDAWKVNVAGVENLLEAARRTGAHFIHISTDYVFDGTSQQPYGETDLPNPINYYGRTKLASENLLRSSLVQYTIVRSALIYGNVLGGKPNLVQKIIDALKNRNEFYGAADQLSTPVYVKDLAQAVTTMFERGTEGLFHIGGPQSVSRYQFALETARANDLDTSLIKPVLSESLQRPAQRPRITDLSIAKAMRLLGYRPLAPSAALMDMRLERETGVLYKSLYS